MPDAQFTVPYPEHTHFVGREDDLARLHAALQGEGPVGINPAALGNPTGVTGQGGIGKTQLAVAYAYRYREHYPDGVYWLNAANEWRIEFSKLADDLNLPITSRTVTLDTADRQRLSSVLATTASLQGGPAARAAFLDIAGLKRFVAGLDLNGSSREVANILVARLEPFGFLPDRPTHHALGALLEYVASLDDTSPDNGRWLRGVIGRYGLIATSAAPQPQDERIIAAFAWLGEHPQSLLILDNVADTTALDEPLTRDCIPALLLGRVLFTTRRRELGRFQPVELKTLPADAALTLLLRDPRRQPVLDPAHPEHAIARDICAVFGYLPLALEIAAAHLAKFHSAPVAAYRDELRRRGALDVIVDQRVPVATRHETGLAAALAAQWATLGQEAHMVFRVAGQLPEAAYVPASRLGLLASVPEEGKSFFDMTLAVALDELNDASLIEELSGDQVRLHPLVREFARDQTPLEERRRFCIDCAKRLLVAFSEIEILERQCDRRGIDALIYDLIATLDMLHVVEANFVPLLLALMALLNLLRREAHNLRSWQRDDAPNFLAQQLHLRLFDSSTPELFGDLGSHLRRSGTAWLPRWVARNESSELEMTLTGHAASVRAVGMTADGRRAVSGGDDGTLLVWNLDTGQSERALTGHTGGVNGVAVTPDGQLAISGGDDGTVRVWNLDTGQSEWTLVGHMGGVNDVAVTPDGQLAVSGGDDGAVRVWNLDTGEEEHTLTACAEEVWAVTVTASGRQIVFGAHNGTLQIWSLDACDVKQSSAEHQGLVSAVAVTPDGWRAVSGGDDGAMYVWNLNTGRTERALTGHERVVNSVAITADGHLAISGGDDGVVRVWNLDTGIAERTLAGHAGWVWAVAVTADGQRAVSGGGDGTLRIWNLGKGATGRAPGGHAGRVLVVTVTPNGQRVLSGDDEGTLRVWNVDTGAVERTLNAGVEQGVAVMSEGRRAVFSGYDGTLSVWNVDTGMVERTLTGHAGLISATAVTPDGLWAVSGGSDRVLRVWNLEIGVVKWTLVGHRDWVRAVAVTPDGQRAVSGDDSGTLRVWNLNSGVDEKTLTGHAGGVTAVAVTSDRRRAVTCGWDRILRHWDLEEGRELGCVAFDAAVTSVAVATGDLPLVIAGDAVGGIYCLEWVDLGPVDSSPPLPHKTC